MPQIIFVGIHTVLIKGQPAVIEASRVFFRPSSGPLAVGDLVVPTYAPGQWARVPFIPQPTSPIKDTP